MLKNVFYFALGFSLLCISCSPYAKNAKLAKNIRHCTFEVAGNNQNFKNYLMLKQQILYARDAGLISYTVAMKKIEDLDGIKNNIENSENCRFTDV